MDALFDLMDVGAAVRGATNWARKAHGGHARVMLVWILLIDIALGWCCWYFDIETTLEYTRAIHNSIVATLSEGLLVYAPVILIAMTVIPTATRQTFSTMAGEHKLIGAAIIILGLFDARTDWPRVRDLFDRPEVWALFDFGAPGAVQTLLWGTARMVALFFATDGFEVLFVAALACTFILARNSIGNGKQTAQKAGA